MRLGWRWSSMHGILVANESWLFNIQVTRRIRVVEDSSTPVFLFIKSYQSRSIHVFKYMHGHDRKPSKNERNACTETKRTREYQSADGYRMDLSRANRKTEASCQRVQKVIKGRPITCRSSHVWVSPQCQEWKDNYIYLVTSEWARYTNQLCINRKTEWMNILLSVKNGKTTED